MREESARMERNTPSIVAHWSLSISNLISLTFSYISLRPEGGGDHDKCRETASSFLHLSTPGASLHTYTSAHKRKNCYNFLHVLHPRIGRAMPRRRKHFAPYLTKRRKGEIMGGMERQIHLSSSSPHLQHSSKPTHSLGNSNYVTTSVT